MTSEPNYTSGYDDGEPADVVRDAAGIPLTKAHLAYALALGNPESAHADGVIHDNPRDNAKRAALIAQVRRQQGL